MTEGIKHDKDKLPYELISPHALEAMATILKSGAEKYGDRNWERGMRWGRVFGAAMRHMWAWWRRDASDPETGKSHLWHALCCLMFLVHYEYTNTGSDDRPKENNVSK